LSRNNRLASRPFWLTVKDEPGRIDVLTANLITGEAALPVFSFEDEARMFLELGALGSWRVRVTSAGELISVLSGPCAGIRRVVLDPLPGLDGEGLNDLLSMEREAFMESLLKLQRRQAFGSGRSTVRRQDGEPCRGGLRLQASGRQTDDSPERPVAR
jgi:hypothetical protein